MSTTTHLRSALGTLHRVSKSTRQKRVAEADNLLKTFRDAAPEQFRAAGNAFAIPYLDRFFDALRDGLVDGKDEARIELVDTRRDDTSLEEADGVSAAIGAYAMTIGYSGRGDWRWHDGSRASGVKSFTVIF